MNQVCSNVHDAKYGIFWQFAKGLTLNERPDFLNLGREIPLGGEKKEMKNVRGDRHGRTSRLPGSPLRRGVPV